MKKQVLIATGLAVLSTSAYATKARMDALGQDADQGSLYILDSRSVFRNAAHVNTFKNYVVTEWGTAGNGADAAGAPQAEGGFFRESGAFSYGLYLGNEQNADNNMRSATNNGYAAQNGAGSVTVGESGFQAHDNAVDLFFSGDMGVQWGARVHYASSKTEGGGNPEASHSALGLGLGMTMGDLEAYTNLELMDESEGIQGSDAGDKWEADTGIQVGVNYRLGDLTFFADYDMSGAEYTDGDGSTTGFSAGDSSETEQTTIEVGVGKTHEISSTSRLYMDIRYFNMSAEDTPAGGGQATEAKSSKLPVTFGYETDATDWLALRGAVSQDLPFLNKQETTAGGSTTESDSANSADVTAGATLNFGKLKVDGMIGTENANGGTYARDTNNGILSLDNVMSRVAVHYWF